MQKTKVLGSLRSIFPPIHQPLLNKSESEKLLSAIKSSFRAQLDKEHDVDFSFEHIKPAPIPTPSLTYLPSSPTPSLHPKRHVHTRPTERHLHAILNNPLFALPQTTESTDASSPWVAHKAVFEKAVGRGLMTIRRAHGFLMLVLAEVKQSAAPNILSGMKVPGAGLLVLQWLRASGLEQSDELIANRAFRALLVKFLVAEGLEYVVWGWIDLHLKEELFGHPGYLLDLVAAKCTDTNLEGAYATVLKGNDIMMEKSMNHLVLSKAWHHLAWQTTVESWRHTTPPVDLFESFVAIGSSIKTTVLRRAHIALYHPTNPSPDLAVDYLWNERNWWGFKEASLGVAPAKYHVQALTSLGIDTVQHLMQADRMREATRILDLFKGNTSFVDDPTARLAV